MDTAERELPVYRTRLIIPGITMLNMAAASGTHTRHSRLSRDMFFPARQPWTKICRGNTGGGGGRGRAFSEGIKPRLPRHR